MRHKNNYGFNNFNFIKRKKISKYLIVICAILVTSLTIGFASFSSSLVMKNIAMIRIDKTVILTGIKVNSTNGGAISRTEEYNVSNIFGDVVLPSKDSYVKYEVDITNLGNVKMGALPPVTHSSICTAVTTATTGNVPTGSFNYGDEYKCKVGDSYTNTFFVLENNTDTVSLIMKENYTDSYVPKTTAWCTDGGSSHKTCKNITATGSNAPDGKDYLGHIKSIFNKSGVEVSFPAKAQIYKAAGNKSSSFPTWLYDYLDKTTHPVTGVSGYWTITPGNFSRSAWIVHYNGYLNGGTPSVSDSRSYGVRPVIKISKSAFGADTSLNYTIDGYSNGEAIPVCDGDNCTNGVTKKIYVTIKYKDGISDSLVTSEPQTFNIGFDYKQIFKVTYDGITCTNCNTEAIEGNTYTATINSSTPSIVMGDVILTKDIDYTYDETTKLLTIPNVNGDITISEGSNYICKAVTTATTGSIPTGNFNYGDEYTCDVGDGDSKTFFVLETSGDNVSLIMNANVGIDGKAVTSSSTNLSTVAWVTKEDYIAAGGTESDWNRDIRTNKGPITVTNALKEYTSAWTNISQITLPTADQIANALGLTVDVDNDDLLENLPTWLHDYLEEATHPVSEVYGYWTISYSMYSEDSTGNYARAYDVTGDGSLYSQDVDANYDGIRPVITIPKSELN